MNHHPWNNNVAVITGAGSGIGKAIAIQLAKRNCHLALVDINEESLKSAQQELSTYPVNISVHCVDACSKEQMAQLPEAVLAEHQQVDMIFNNAGLTIEKPFSHSSMAELELIINLNLWGVVYGCHYFLPYLKQRPEAYIVNTSSLASFLGIPTQSGYCLTKAAVKALSESLWAELKGENIHVTSVHPGAIKTNIFKTAIEHSDDKNASKQLFDRVERMAMQPEKAAEKIIKAVEKKRQRVVIGIDAHMLEFAKRLMPVSIHRIFAWGFSKKHHKKS